MFSVLVFLRSAVHPLKQAAGYAASFIRQSQPTLFSTDLANSANITIFSLVHKRKGLYSEKANRITPREGRYKETGLSETLPSGI